MKTTITAAAVALATLTTPVLAQNAVLDDVIVNRAAATLFVNDKTTHSPRAQAILERIQAESHEGTVTD